MREIRQNRVTRILHRLAAEFVRDISTSASLITITRVEISPSGKESKIFFSTLPDSMQDTARKFLERKTPEFINLLKERSRLGNLPHVDFKIDFGERSRQRLDELSREK